MPTGSQIRRMFLDFFVEKGHREVHSSSLVPQNDPTLLFTNAGMNQFKDVFLGLEKRDYTRATTSQKCVRAGGKHNDLENVGFTNRHHTFFEMLGNFSFGDYFKKDAIAYAWELITSPKWFGIPKDKLYATIFKGENGVERDAEAYDLWVAQGVSKDRIYEFGAKDNFWQMGDTGPCGPCSEIHYDMGAIASDLGHTDCEFGCDCGRYVEIWNLVFMQFDRDASGRLTPLPKPSIDTGAGLERVTAVLQGVISNYETDLFTPLIQRAVELTDAKAELRSAGQTRASAPTRAITNPDTGHEATTKDVGTGASHVQAERRAAPEGGTHGAASLRVIADHSRAATFLISDGVIPSNEGRGYVLRKIIRRAITHGRLLGQNQPFLHQMVFAVRDLMQDAYPELKETADRVSKAILAEETRFAHTLDVGLQKLETLLDQAKKGWRFSGSDDDAIATAIRETGGSVSPDAISDFRNRDRRLPGEEAFKLYDTFGMPLDFMQDAARDQGIVFDQAGFDAAMDEQRQRAKASWKGAAKQTANPEYQKLPTSVFEGYRQTRSEACEVLALLKNGQGAKDLKPGDEGEVILDHTPFYAEAGGQVGDRGWLYSDDHNTVVAEVTGTYYPVQAVRAHKILVKQPIRVGDKVDAVVDTSIREATMRNHTATHLLHAGLREVLGKHVKQAGSLVAPGHLRFDFSHFTSVADEELQDIEDIINKEVLRNRRVETIENVPIDVAVNEYHAMALFGEKYGDKVRVIRIGDFSTELCGGTHTAATGEIGLIKILKEGSVSSGVRRVEAITGEGSVRHFRKDHQLENVVATLAAHADGTTPAEALKLELEKRDAEIKRLARELDQVRMKSASSSVAATTERIRDVKGVKVLAHRVDNLERPQMRTLVDQLRNKIGSGVVVLGSAVDGRVALIAGVTKDLTNRIQAGKVIGQVAQKVGGKGGGRPDMAEAGGDKPEALDAALGEVYEIVGSMI
jgi:alanyl-tRNA synthetase